jgi:cytosine/creatinine deaminase
MLLHDATLLDGSEADVRLDGDRIADVGRPGSLVPSDDEEVLDLAGYVLLPAPAEPHAHLDKALTAERVEVQAGDLDAAIEAWHAHRVGLGEEDIARRAESAALIALARGVTAVRTHVDVGEGIELRAAEALVSVRDRLRPLMDIQVVALSYPLAGVSGAANRALVRAALELGVDAVGGAPHIDPDPVGHIEVCLGLAAEFGRPVDLHMDEHLGSSVDLEDMVRLMGDGFPQPVTASHCTSLGMRSAEVQDRLAAGVARAGIAVVTCPGTNLHLLGRGVRTATPRGLTALPALLGAGVLVAGGGDNVQDFFHPLGCGDPLQTAALLVLAGQLDVQTAYRLVSENARAVMGLPGGGIAPGGPGDLVAVAGGSLQEALSTTTEDRIVFRAGRVVRRTSVVPEQVRSMDLGGSDA